MDPITLALAGLLAYRTYQGQGKLEEWIGHQGPNTSPGPAPGLNLPPLLEKQLQFVIAEPAQIEEAIAAYYSRSDSPSAD